MVDTVDDTAAETTVPTVALESPLATTTLTAPVSPRVMNSSPTTPTRPTGNLRSRTVTPVEPSSNASPVAEPSDLERYRMGYVAQYERHDYRAALHVFIAVPKAARRYRFETTPSSYLLGIAANSASKHIRASKRRRAASERFSQVPLAPVSTPDDEAHAARLVDQLMRAVDQLPDKLRIVFVLCQIEERDATEVGAILDLPSSTVRARLRAAREHLQRQDPWASAGENA